MCGRMSAGFDSHLAEKQKEFMITKIEKEFGPCYNLAPSMQIPVVVPGSRILTTLRWGLIPFWAKDKKIGYKLINARAESLTEKASFRTAFSKRRCLILASGFYEWDKEKKPHYISLKGQKIFAFAGLWEEWNDKESGEKIKTCTIITCEPNNFMKKIHRRMPVILNSEDYEEWLNSDNKDLDILSLLLKPIDSSLMKEHEVSKDVGSPKNQGEDLIKPISSVLL
jgi:putative SOS response-associated peptidase YedK